MPAGGREKMRYIVNSREMNLYDSRTIEEFHMPQAVLMERAAFSFVETLRREKRNTSRTLVVCGSGNNGNQELLGIMTKIIKITSILVA